MARFYRRAISRFEARGEVELHAMPERGGLGRTDRVVDHFRGMLEAAGRRGEQIDLAGHSLGGIVAWVLAHEYPEVVRRAELWCAPVRGTALGRVGAPIPELRFLARDSRFLRRYDTPTAGPVVRAVYTVLDPLAVPAYETCYLEGQGVENHVVTPVPRWRTRENEFVHRAAVEHVVLPRVGWLNDELARRDASL